MMKDIVIKDRVGVQNFTSTVPYVVISITDTTRHFPALKNVDNLKNVLRLRFTDDDHDINQNKDGMKFDCKLFTADQALKIWRFLNDADYDYGLIVCQCDGGISRSSAIAAAIWKVLTNDDSVIFRDKRYVPNMLVYRTMLDTFDKEFMVKGDKKKEEKEEKKKEEVGSDTRVGGYALFLALGAGAIFLESYVMLGIGIYILFSTMVMPSLRDYLLRQ